MDPWNFPSKYISRMTNNDRQELFCSHHRSMVRYVYLMLAVWRINHFSTSSRLEMILLLLSAIPFLALVQGQHFFGPPAIGFGAGIIGHTRKVPVATSIVSRRSARSYSHQSFIQATPHGVTGYRTSTYTSTDHYQTANHVSYYQPNQYHYHSSPWSYRWGRSADLEARERREAKLEELGDFSNIPASSISKIAANVSIAYQPQVWANDMVYKDQDDCSALLCSAN